MINWNSQAKRKKEPGELRTMPMDKLLKTIPTLQAQVDALLEFDASPSDLCHSVIMAAFMLLFKASSDWHELDNISQRLLNEEN